MAKTREQKKQTVEQLTDKFSKMKAAVFASFEGLSVSATNELRNLCRQSGVDYMVAKKTLINKALDQSGLKDINSRDIKGSVATAIGYEDEIMPAKILNKFAKTNQALVLKGGIFENKFIDLVKVNELAAIPSKPELLAKLVGSLSSPMVGLVNVLQGNLRGLVGVLSAIKDKKNN
ncbi:MAG: 50S ribosomal protein L10 [bacterium]